MPSKGLCILTYLGVSYSINDFTPLLNIFPLSEIFLRNELVVIREGVKKYSAYQDNFVKTIFLKSSLTLKSRPKFWSLVWINIQHETVSWLIIIWDDICTSMGSLLVNTLELRKKTQTHTSNNTISFNKPILDLEWTNVKFSVEIFWNF